MADRTPFRVARTLVRCALAALVTSALLVAAHPATAANLVGHWALDETSEGTAADGVNSNDGAWQNGTSTNLAWTDGAIGRSADLNDLGGAGANNFFQIPSINQLTGADGLSLSVWVDPETQGTSGYNGIFNTRSINGTNQSWGVAIENNGLERLDSRVENQGVDSPNGALDVAVGWVHVALAWDGNTQTHTQYVNGIETGSVSTAAIGALASGTISGVTQGPWFLGYDNCCGSNRDFDGRIDDGSAWAGALTATEVNKIYQAGLDGVGADAALASTPNSGPIQSGLIGSWNMDQPTGSSGAAESVNGSQAVLNSMDINTDWEPSSIGRALDFDGGDDQAIISGAQSTSLNAAANGLTELTISAWVRSDGANNNNEGILEHRGPGNSNLTGLNTPGNVADNYDFRLVNNSLKSATGTLTPGQWQHVVGVWESGSRFELYIDGALSATAAAPSPSGGLIAVGDWRFGNDTCCTNRFFNGAIDDTGLWGRALSAAEVAALYDAGLDSISNTNATARNDGGMQQQLVGHWTFDQARFSPNANDTSLAGTSADATLTSMDAGTDWVGGKLQGALDFDGSNDQAIINGAEATALNGAVNGATALTMSIWVRSDGNNNNNEGIFQHRSPISNGNFTGFDTPSAGSDNFDFRIVNTSIKSADSTLINGQWQHLVGVWEQGSRFELYIDGVLSTSGTPFAGTLIADGDWRFGNDICCGAGREFDGALDDAALWTRAFTAGQVADLYTSGLAGLNAAVAVPEPSSLLLLLGGIGLVATGRRRRH